MNLHNIDWQTNLLLLLKLIWNFKSFELKITLENYLLNIYFIATYVIHNIFCWLKLLNKCISETIYNHKTYLELIKSLK